MPCHPHHRRWVKVSYHEPNLQASRAAVGCLGSERCCAVDVRMQEAAAELVLSMGHHEKWAEASADHFQFDFQLPVLVSHPLFPVEGQSRIFLK